MSDLRPAAGTSRRQILSAAAGGMVLGLVHPTALAAGRSARARYGLKSDFKVPAETFGIVPWSETRFRSGYAFSLQAGGKVLIQEDGLYELVFSSDWDATYGRDIDLRKIGLRLQQKGQPDEPMDDHERLGFLNIPGSDPPVMARYEGHWAPPPVPQSGGIVSVDVPVSPAGGVRAGDSVIASHTGIALGALPDWALTALVVQAKVIGPDMVRVTLYNPSHSGAITVPSGSLRVVAMNAARTRGRNADAWMVLHTPSIELKNGDRVYALIEHKVTGTLLQASRSSYLQIDRLD